MQLDKIITQITAHAARDFPREACGLILKSGGSHTVLVCDNCSHEPTQSFLINPLVFAEHDGNVAAVYHSHPNRSPLPSPADVLSAERCGVPFLIIGYPSEQIYTYSPRGTKPDTYEGREFVYGVNDCLSLVTDYYFYELGIVIDDGQRKSWGWWHDADNQHDFINGFINQGFARVDAPKENDIIIMQTSGGQCPNHAAIYLGDNTLLHHPALGSLSCKELYGQYWRSTTVAILRRVNEND